MILQLEHISKSFGGRVLFHDVTFKLEEYDRLALVGPNGAGKTTMLNIISGEEDADEGRVLFAKGARVGYLEQEAIEMDEQPIFDEVMASQVEVLAAEKRLRMLEESLGENPTERDLAAAGRARDEFERLGGYVIEAKVRGVLFGLGFKEDDMRRMTSEFSGGWQMRIALAKLLIRNPEVLLLDEPTNHLDLRSVEWLEDYIRHFKGTVLTISHDRYFLDQVVQRIIEISAGKAEFYSGNYSFYLEEKQERFNHQLRQYEQEQAKLKQLGFTVERMKGWGINNRVLYRRAMSIQHRMERIEKTERPTKEKTLRARFGEKEFHGDEVLTVKNLSKQFGGRTLFSGVELTVRGGERIALLGDNGTGKTTFLRVLLGELPAEGKIKFGPSVKSGYLPQVIHFAHPERTLYDTMLYEKNCTPQTARDRLGAFLFSGEDVFKTVGTLSGGEQSRLRLCMLMDEKINLLVLDEPTNHLDVASREWIECALEDYEGTLIFVSHDRYFVDKFATRVWELSDGTIRDFPCGYAKYRAILEHEAAARQRPAQPKKEKQAKPVSGSKELEKLVRRLEREIAAKEDEAAQLEQALAGAASDYQELLRLTAEKERCEAELEDLMARWEEAAQALEQG